MAETCEHGTALDWPSGCDACRHKHDGYTEAERDIADWFLSGRAASAIQTTISVAITRGDHRPKKEPQHG